MGGGKSHLRRHDFWPLGKFEVAILSDPLRGPPCPWFTSVLKQQISLSYGSMFACGYRKSMSRYVRLKYHPIGVVGTWEIEIPACLLDSMNS